MTTSEKRFFDYFARLKADGVSADLAAETALKLVEHVERPGVFYLKPKSTPDGRIPPQGGSGTAPPREVAG